MKIETKTVHKVDAFDLENLVIETYSLAPDAYSFQADEECANDTSHEYQVTGEVDEYEAADIESLKAGEFPTFVTGAVLNDLARIGLIPTGDYVVSLSY